MSLTLEQTLASILQSLANFFGVTTQTIMENAPMWLAKYGWYVTVKGLGLTIMGGLFLGVIVVVVIWAVALSCELNITSRGLIALSIFLMILIVFGAVTIDVIPCMIAPEYVGVEELFSLLQN